ncbi:MAG TPA: S8 family serine peptidase [Gaiellaceae bacterium]|nr:S8 family serine peptidase [Gaiellaceae bacterium]
MRTGGLAVLALCALVFATPVSASAESPAAEFVPGEIIVRFKPGLTMSAQRAAAATEGATIGEPLLLPGASVVELTPGASVVATIEALEQRPDVLYAQPNYVYRAAASPSDPFFGLLWGLQNSGQIVEERSGRADADIDAPEAWSIETGTDAVKVAVVDSGVEYDHPDLAGNIAARGWDFFSGDDDPQDENGHGTHVAGTIGAQGDNSVGVTGVSWNVGLMPVRVLGPTGSGTTATVVNGLAYAVQHGAKIVNASLGGGNWDPTLASTIEAASETLFVFAAGNGGWDGVGDDNDLYGFPRYYPCGYPSANVVCVAATDLSDAAAAFSNYGTTSVDLAAPGVKIGSTYVGGSYVYSNGTSMAAPHVAGAAALLLARAPSASVAEVRAALLGSVDALPHLATKVATSGRLNAHRALLAIAPGAPQTPLPPPPATQVQPRRAVQKACLVPRLAGKTVAQSRRALHARSCALGSVRRVYSPRVPRGRVISQSRRRGTRLPQSARVSIVVSHGRRR